MMAEGITLFVMVVYVWGIKFLKWQIFFPAAWGMLVSLFIYCCYCFVLIKVFHYSLLQYLLESDMSYMEQITSMLIFNMIWQILYDLPISVVGSHLRKVLCGLSWDQLLQLLR